MDADTVTPAVPVTFVSSHAGRGGSERYLGLLLDHLRRDWIVTVVCLQDGPFARELGDKGYPVEVIDTGRRATDLVRSARRLRRVFARTAPAVVHANGLKAALVAELAGLRGKPPVIWFKHDVARDGWLARVAARRSARVIGVSGAVTEAVSGVAEGKVEVIHCQIPDPHIDPAAARRLVLTEFAPEEPTTVVSLVGRLDPFKGQDEVIDALPSVLDRAPGVRILFVGGEDPAHPQQRAALDAEIADRGLADAVRFTGYRADATGLIAGSDVLVIPSIAKDGFGKEGFPYVGLEALALRTPIVCYAHGGLPEQVGECGVLVDPGDRAALADAIVALADSPDERDRLAACGRDRFADLFAWSTLADDVTDRYRTVAAGVPA